MQWTRECWGTMKPHRVEGAYGNYVTDEGETVARAAYGVNYDRLGRQKTSTTRQTYSDLTTILNLATQHRRQAKPRRDGK